MCVTFESIEEDVTFVPIEVVVRLVSDGHFYVALFESTILFYFFHTEIITSQDHKSFHAQLCH